MAGIRATRRGEHYWVTSINFPPAFMDFDGGPARYCATAVRSPAAPCLRLALSEVADVLADPDFTCSEAQKLGDVSDRSPAFPYCAKASQSASSSRHAPKKFAPLPTSRSSC